jgi:hypothetical protein
LFLVVVTLAGAGCGTAITGSGPGARAQWPAAAGDSVSADAPASPTEEPTVVVEATSPTDVQFVADKAQVVRSWAAVRRTNVIERRRRTFEGALLGAALGAFMGGLGGAEHDRASCDPNRGCDEPTCHAGPLAFGVIGIALGAVAGAMIGHRE